jgi:predicted RNase H-like HicB family nuclease
VPTGYPETHRVSVGDTIEEAEQMIREAIALHIEGMRGDGLEIPPPTSIGREIEIEVTGGR